ncbi:hypothetical protein PoB_002382800 [Plakobranchus ocellatus]|uniref:Uncharacterized protein n=1 Tax=Plakobranchus ocellatus TaxID=259542 RepID=A0AAV3ZR56_9GAST|nr:hypothetical protein PoB_002382800 [Plakobranchus ocellatus]
MEKERTCYPACRSTRVLMFEKTLGVNGKLGRAVEEQDAQMEGRCKAIGMESKALSGTKIKKDKKRDDCVRGIPQIKRKKHREFEYKVNFSGCMRDISSPEIMHDRKTMLEDNVVREARSPVIGFEPRQVCLFRSQSELANYSATKAVFVFRVENFLNPSELGYGCNTGARFHDVSTGGAAKCSTES